MDAAACVTARSGNHGHRCAQDEGLRAEPICLPSCSKDGACEAGFYCEAGACWPAVARVPPTTGGISRWTPLDPADLLSRATVPATRPFSPAPFREASYKIQSMGDDVRLWVTRQIR